MFNKNALLDQLYSYIQIKTPLSPLQKLDHVRSILNYFGNPHTKFKSFHITGTKGKGSTAHYLSHGLKNNGFKVGLFTSPHIFEETERIQINEEPILWEDLAFYLEKIFTAIDSLKKKIGFFDILTISSFLYFCDKKVDCAVIEVGVGAQFDPTIVLQPEVSIVTQIGLDHTELLGETIEDIATTKSYIIKPKTPIYIQNQSSKIINIFRERAHDLNSPFHLCANDEKWDKYFPLLPSFQKQNLFLVNQILLDAKMKGVLDDIEGFSHLKITGRFQKIDNILLDVAHNPLSIKVLIENYRKLIEDPMKQTIVFIYTKPQKDFETIINLFPKSWILYFVNIKNAFIQKEHPIFLDEEKYKHIQIISDFSNLRLFDPKKTQILITGSFLLIENFLETTRKKDLTL